MLSSLSLSIPPDHNRGKSRQLSKHFLASSRRGDRYLNGKVCYDPRRYMVAKQPAERVDSSVPSRHSSPAAISATT